MADRELREAQRSNDMERYWRLWLRCNDWPKVRQMRLKYHTYSGPENVPTGEYYISGANGIKILGERVKIVVLTNREWKFPEKLKNYGFSIYDGIEYLLWLPEHGEPVKYLVAHKSQEDLQKQLLKYDAGILIRQHVASRRGYNFYKSLLEREPAGRPV